MLFMMHREQSSASTYSQPHPVPYLPACFWPWRVLQLKQLQSNNYYLCAFFSLPYFLEATLDLVQSVTHGGQQLLGQTNGTI